MEAESVIGSICDLDETIDEPQITSLDKNERKLARQLRIERRIEKLGRQNLGRRSEIITGPTQKDLLHQQLEKSWITVEKLLTEAANYVTAVRVTSDSREEDKREKEGIGRAKVIKCLEDDAVLAQQMFDEIDMKWQKILKADDPLHIHEKMEDQKEKCEDLIAQKDAIIAMLKEEIKKVDRKFSSSQFQHIGDVATLAQRIEQQVRQIRKAYREELKIIEDILLVEKHLLCELNDKKWDELYKKRESEESNLLEKKMEQKEDFDIEMDKIRMSFQEQFRATNRTLKQSVAELTEDHEIVKAMAMANRERLDYNYQILRKREDENLIIKSQQKRKINKLQDVLNDLRMKIREYDEKTKLKIAGLQAEVKNLQKCVVEIKNKAASLSKINDLRHKQVWALNVEEADDVLNQILTIDRILYEQQLGVEWKKPECAVIRKNELLSYKTGMHILRQEKEMRSHEVFSSMSVVSKVFLQSSISLKDNAGYKNLLQNILEQLSGKVEFLAEGKLNVILEPYLEEDKTLVKIDNVFSALDIKKSEDIDLMIKYFFIYAKCDICQKSCSSLKDSDITLSYQGPGDESVIGGSSVTDSEKDLFPTIMKTVNESEEFIDTLMQDYASDSDSSTTLSYWESTGLSSITVLSLTKSARTEDLSLRQSAKTSITNKLFCRFGHPLVINPVYAMRALRQFVSDFYLDKSGAGYSSLSKSEPRSAIISRLLAEKDVKVFWERYRQVFSDNKEHLWNGLFVGLEKYYNILKDRKRLNNDVMALRKTNRELKRLLTNYVSLKEKKPPCAEQKELPYKSVFASSVNSYS